MPDNATLLQRYLQDGDEEAFADLVKRHLNLVWGAARRITGDADLARDVAQTVFADLARKAASLPSGVLIEGWLYRAACLAAAKLVREQSRRSQREKQAMEWQTPGDSTGREAQQAEALQPLLDEALGQLDETDRQAVVLRFLAGRSFAEIGATLGLSDDTAQKRVSRALGRLREQFRQRGVSTTEGGLLLALGAAGSQVAPSGLAAAVTVSALAGLGTAGWLQTLTIMKAKIALTAAAVVLVVVPLTMQYREVNRLREENRALLDQAAQATALRTENERLARLKLDADELERLRAEHVELMRLRGEVGRLRAAARVPATVQVKPQPDSSNTVPTRMLLSPTKIRVKDGETLVTGGWTTADGRRGIVMVTPQIGDSGNGEESQITASFTLLEGTDSAFAAAGLGDIRGEGSGTAAQRFFNPTETAALLRRLEATGEIDLLAAPRLSTLDGRQAQITDGGVGVGGMNTVVNFIPKIDAAAEGAVVEMTLLVTQAPSQPPESASTVLPLPVFSNPAGQNQSEDGGFTACSGNHVF